tara:strand:- start:3978 stop:5858 length:1881 start_codon:yes stop_codon:yes gene_type:complete
MRKKILFFTVLFIIPLFFIKSSNIYFDENYQDIKIRSSNSLTINNTVYSFKSIFRLNVSAYGYESKDFTFNHQEVEKLIRLVEKPVNVNFRINKPFNIFILNNEILENITDVPLIKGLYSFEVISENHITYKSNFEIKKYNKEIFIPIILEDVDKKIFIDTNPKGSSIILNNIEIGLTPLSVNLNKSSNEIILKKQNFKNKKIDLTIKDNKDISLFYELDPDENQISIITSPTAATIFLNEEYIGISPLKFSNIKKGILKIKKYGFLDIEVDITKNTKNINLKLKEDMSRVSFYSDPITEVYLNDDFIGTTPFTKDIQKIKYKIMFQRKGYRNILEDFEATTDITEVRKVLLTEKEASILENPIDITNSIDSKMILISPGKIKVGSSKKQSRRDINEIERDVEITKHFYISKNLVTEKQYNEYINISKKTSLPVNNISWIDAAKFCNWLSNKEGLTNFYIISNDRLTSINKNSNGYRLPSEAEWEYVAKSNNPNDYIFSWGSNRKITKLVGNIADTSTQGILSSFISDYDDGYEERSPVGTFRSNQNNIFDITGNLSEWVHDFYAVEFIDTTKIYQDYIGPQVGTSHVIKGSNYYSSTSLQLGLSYRTYGNDANELVGFRIARWIY